MILLIKEPLWLRVVVCRSLGERRPGEGFPAPSLIGRALKPHRTVCTPAPLLLTQRGLPVGLSEASEGLTVVSGGIGILL